jgi:hypothetical protein
MPGDGPLTSPERVRAVSALADAVARNLQITQSYHELLVALDRHLGFERDLNWCAFATWASKQAGVFIRHDELPAALRRFLRLDGARPRRWTPTGFLLSDRFRAYARMTAEDMSAHLAEGNRLVYTLLAPFFAGLVAHFRDHPEPDPAARDAFLAAIPAEPATGDELRRAFAQLWAARFEPDPKRRAERILAANLLVGFHEQRRLQEAIDGALSAPIRRALDDPRRVWFAAPLPLWLRLAGARLFRLALAPWIRRVEAEWKAAVTGCLMTLALPTGRLELGADLPPLPDGSMYPEALRELALAEALAVLAAIDRTPGTLRGSAARDWARLEDRMNYVADFFRSRQQERSLLTSAPFTAEQAAAIHAGRVPAGPL